MGGVTGEAFVPELRAVLETIGVEEKEPDISTTKLDVKTAESCCSRGADDLLNTELEILEFGGFKGDCEKLMHNGGMNTGNGITEKDDEDFLGTHVE